MRANLPSFSHIAENRYEIDVDILKKVFKRETKQYTAILNSYLEWDLKLDVNLYSMQNDCYGFVNMQQNYLVVNFNLNNFVVSKGHALYYLKEVIPHEVAHCFSERIIPGNQHGDVWTRFMKILNKPAEPFAYPRLEMYIKGCRR